MALYQYNNWVNLEGAERLARLRLHIQEVTAMLGPDTSGPDHSQSSKSLKEYAADLGVKEEKLAEEVAMANRRVFSRARFRRR